VKDLRVFHHVLTPDTERVLYDANATVKNGAHLVIPGADELGE
jgi:hypothetical protein